MSRGHGLDIRAAPDRLPRGSSHAAPPDELDPQVPFECDTTLRPEAYTGNQIVLDLGGGVFALYAHLLGAA